MPFALDIAKDLDLYVVAYFTQPWLASLVYYHINEGTYDVPVDRHENPTLASFPGFPLLSQDDLPSFACEKGSYPLLHEFVVRQFSNLLQADCILCNTFDQLEPKVTLLFRLFLVIILSFSKVESFCGTCFFFHR